MQHIFEVQGIACNNCERKVRDAVGKMANAKLMYLDKHTGKLILESNEDSLENELIQVLPEKFTLVS